MRLCFILEAAYQDDEMPRSVAEGVRRLGHEVELLDPSAGVTSLSELVAGGALDYDAFVLKTAPDGPGLSILEAAGAAGIPTLNPWRSIRLARDKAVAVPLARANGIPMPPTFFASSPCVLELIHRRHYPLVVKPKHGGGNRPVYRVDHPDQLRLLELERDQHYLAQPYIENAGYDVKLYNTGQEIFAVRWPSPLHPDRECRPRLLPVSRELKDLALRFGRVFGLRIYGIDLLPTHGGLVPVDINDFPSFREVPEASARLAASVVDLVAEMRAGMRRGGRGVDLRRAMRLIAARSRRRSTGPGRPRFAGEGAGEAGLESLPDH